MTLRTKYLDYALPHPLIAGAGPLTDNLDGLRRLEDAGAAMVVLRSLFEEEIALPPKGLKAGGAGASLHRPEDYLEYIRKAKAAVKIPIAASLNGTTQGGWLEFAKLMQDAGANILELNVYDLATDIHRSSRSMEEETVEMVRQVKHSVVIPVSVKLSPFFTSLSNFAYHLDTIHADGLVLFNRFYQPDVDVEKRDVAPLLHLSDPSELPLRLRWAAILSGRLEADIAVTGGVHTANDVLKAVMCGATTVQLTSALLKNGPEHLTTIRKGLEQWMNDHGCKSLDEIRGCLNLKNCRHPKALERANYMQILSNWTA